MTLPGTPAQNDIVVVVLASDFRDGHAIAEADYNTLNSNQDPGCTIAWKRQGASPDTAVTIGAAGGAGRVASAIAVVYRGVDTVTAMDAADVDSNAASGDPDCGSLTTVTDGAVRVICAAVEAEEFDDTAAAPSGFGNLVAKDTVDQGIFGATALTADKTEATAGALDPAAFTGGAGTGAWRATHLALRPAAVAATGAPNMLLLGVG